MSGLSGTDCFKKKIQSQINNFFPANEKILGRRYLGHNYVFYFFVFLRKALNSYLVRTCQFHWPIRLKNVTDFNNKIH